MGMDGEGLPSPDTQEPPLRAFPRAPTPDSLVNLDNEPDQNTIHYDRTRAAATAANAEILRSRPRGWKGWLAWLLADLRNLWRRSLIEQSDGSVQVNVAVATRSGSLQNGIETAVQGTAVKIYTGDDAAKEVLVQNTGLARIRVGAIGVTATTGFRIEPGGHRIWNDPVPVNDLYAIRETSVNSIAFTQRLA